MGEIADMMLDGTMCQGCGEWLHDGDDGPGFPGYCSACEPDEDEGEELVAVAFSTHGLDLIVGDCMKVLKKQMPKSAKLHVEVEKQITRQLRGIFKNIYDAGGGIWSNASIETTLRNNEEQRERNAKRRAKKARHAVAL
jgi:hypothetical protein